MKSRIFILLILFIGTACQRHYSSNEANKRSFSLTTPPSEVEDGYAPKYEMNKSGNGMMQMKTPSTNFQDFNTEEYNRIYDNNFKVAINDPLSTFSIDVDAASYSNVRRFILGGQLPPPDAVRIEELVNYFDYNYPNPEGKDRFSLSTEMATCPWSENHKLVRIGLQGKKIEATNLPDANLVFLVDVSGSMDEPDKLPLVKKSLHLLVDQLGKKDRIAIVVYAGEAGVVLPSTSCALKDSILSAIENLSAGGSTAGGEGIKLAYKIAKDNFKQGGNNRVILCTDGDFNVGVSSDGDLERLIESKRNDGIFLSVLGFGTGNYKDSKMETLADKGNGNYAYIDNILEAKKVLVNEIGATLLTIAADVKIQVEFNPARVAAYRLIGYKNRLLNNEDFNDDKKDAGELGAGHTVTALYEIVPVGEKIPGTTTDKLKYQDTKVNPNAANSNELMTVKLRFKIPGETTSTLVESVVKDDKKKYADASENFRFAASVAEWGMILRNSEFKENSTFGQVLTLANGSKGIDTNGYRSEFIRLVEMSSLIEGPKNEKSEK